MRLINVLTSIVFLVSFILSLTSCGLDDLLGDPSTMGDKGHVGDDQLYIIPIDPKGGECEMTRWIGKIGQPYGELPVLEKQGRVFLGWYADGVQINSDSIATEVNSIYAGWQLNTAASFFVLEDLSIAVTGTSDWAFKGILNPGQPDAMESTFAEIWKCFDFEALRSEGYRMEITLNYSIKDSFDPINFGTMNLGTDYTISFSSTHGTFASVSDTIVGTEFQKREFVISDIDLELIDRDPELTMISNRFALTTISNIIVEIKFIK